MPAIDPDSARAPDISVCLPTRDGGAVLIRALDAVFAQDEQRAFEVIALDSGSTDGTRARLDAYPLRVVEVDRAGFDWGQMRDRLFAEARGPIVVNLSQDAVPANADWLARLTHPLDDPEVAVSCGPSIPDPHREFPQFQWERNGYFYFTREMAAFRARHGRGLSFANTAVRRSVWERMRIGAQATGEDFQFQIKLNAAGARIVFPEDAPVLHHHNYSLRGVYRRCRNEGLALREMDFPYTARDALRDLVSAPKYVQWLRELRRGSLRTPAEWCYPVLRPIAVYAGSRFARRMVWY